MRSLISEHRNQHHVNKPLADRICKLPSCGKRFTPTRRWSFYCCKACKEMYWSLVRLEGIRIMEGANQETDKSNIGGSKS